MLTGKRAAVLLMVLCGSLLAAAVTLRSQNPDNQDSPRWPNKKREQIDKNKWPVADYESPGPVNEQVRRQRETKGKNFDKSKFEVNPASVSENYFLTHSDTDLLPPLPTALSDIVVIGDVIESRACMSNDKTGVYSEFTVRIAEVVKNSAEQPVSLNDQIEVLREGGRVRLHSGRTLLYSVSKENMPEVQQRYVFFLRSLDGTQAFKLLTGYLLKDGKVFPLDEHDQFKAYKNADEGEFLSKVRASQ
jgi:hypothetical protein